MQTFYSPWGQNRQLQTSRQCCLYELGGGKNNQSCCIRFFLSPLVPLIRQRNQTFFFKLYYLLRLKVLKTGKISRLLVPGRWRSPLPPSIRPWHDCKWYIYHPKIFSFLYCNIVIFLMKMFQSQALAAKGRYGYRISKHDIKLNLLISTVFTSLYAVMYILLLKSKCALGAVK